MPTSISSLAHASSQFTLLSSFFLFLYFHFYSILAITRGRFHVLILGRTLHDIYSRVQEFLRPLRNAGAQDSSVGIANRYLMKVSGLETRCGSEFPHRSRQALGPAQPSATWEPGVFLEAKAAGALCWLPTPIQHRVSEWIRLFLYFRLCLHGILWENLRGTRRFKQQNASSRRLYSKPH